MSTTVFWRKEPLTSPEAELFALVLEAHGASAMRDNISGVVFLNAFSASGRYSNALAAALCTLGGTHGPIEQTYDFLHSPHPAAAVPALLLAKQKVLGWGNSFYRGVPDPLWAKVDKCLADHFPEMSGKLEAVTRQLHGAGRMLFPNPSAYTAAAALILRLPRDVSPFLFVSGRLNHWTARLIAQDS